MSNCVGNSMGHSTFVFSVELCIFIPDASLSQKDFECRNCAAMSYIKADVKQQRHLVVICPESFQGRQFSWKTTRGWGWGGHMDVQSFQADCLVLNTL